MEKTSTLHLGFCFDQGYLPPFYVLLASVFYHNKANTIVIHVIATGITEQDAQRLTAYVSQNGAQINFYSLDQKLVEGVALPKDGYLTEAAYYRLFFARLIPDSIGKLLYIDIDTVVVGDLSGVYGTDLGTYPLAAVRDSFMPLREDLGLRNTEDYFNSGVTLINLAQWKKKHVTEQALEAVSTKPRELFRYADQDALNFILAGDWYRLPIGYNLTGVHCPDTTDRKILDSFLEDKFIIHFSGEKPWNYLTKCTHVYRYKWFEYFSKSPVKDRFKYFDVKASRRFIRKLSHNLMLELYFKYPVLGHIKRRLLGTTVA